MIRRILSTALTEMHIARRNRWVLIAILLMVVFSLVLSAAGSAPTGALGADRLSVVVASLTSLSVYLVPLVALLMSFDAVAGEIERGTLPLLLTYPIARWEVLAGKLLAHTTIMIVAILAGYGVAAAITFSSDPDAVAGLGALWRLTWTSVLLGATFLGVGYALSSMARRVSGAAGLAIGLWLGLVVLYDLGLLAAVVADEGGTFTTDIFPVALLANPADAFRLFNLSAAQAMAASSGVGGAANAIPQWQSLLSVLLWPPVALGLAALSFRRVEP
ncbi:ABC transporter permease [Sedimentitalea todarodis]|uniref:ABC transporter permease subunit n=1 Tax=Sedimentitalea todarodis TaxID=1631240 RepID=A0ABU3VHE0_9RHOB|nr:ABC transporter permease subunit [Sedimentitalea todarodis]MDU9005599.1 ABC transporter permease subunit [Sedimentitalea todarodis]